MSVWLMGAAAMIALPAWEAQAQPAAASIEKVDLAAQAKIRTEGLDASRSQVMEMLYQLTDRNGPRLTGTPGHERAAKWSADKMREWGMANAGLEAWDFGHPGWVCERATARLLAPVVENLDLRAQAWTPSTKGTISGEAIQLVPPTQAGAELDAFMKENAAKVKGKIVLLGRAATPDYTPQARAITEARGGGARGARAGAGGRAGARGTRGTPAPPNPELLLNEWLATNGAAGRFIDGRGANGQMGELYNRSFSPDKAVPGAIVRNEDYGRIQRLLAHGETVKIELNIETKWLPEGTTSHNVIAEIPGSDKADEVVMLGGHLDSWVMATGASDNATGCVMMMEAARILQAAGLKPRRTVRVALWSGEEQGLLGSRAYVKAHFGTIDDPKPEFAKHVAYFNIDSGAGAVRQASVFGPETSVNAIEAAIAPFADIDSSGSVQTLSRTGVRTDSGSFNEAGLLSVSLRQHASDYNITHHTNYDTYEHADPEQLRRGATVIAALVWHAANREEALPGFTKETLPPLE